MSARCPVHGMSDCSPLLNACSWVTNPQGQAEAHTSRIAEAGTACRTERLSTVRWAVGCNGCAWVAARKAKRDALAAHQAHLADVQKWGSAL